MIVYTRKAFPQDANFNTSFQYHSLERVLDRDSGKSHYQLVGQHPTTLVQVTRILDAYETHSALEAFFLQ